MPFDSTVWNVSFWVFGLVLGLGVRLLIFQASWALSSLDDPPFSRVVATVTPLWVITFIGGILLDGVVFKPLGSTPRIGGLVAITFLASVLDFAVYFAFLRPGPGKAVFIASCEFVLTLLTGVLVTGLVFVGVAINQLAGGAHVQGPLLSPMAMARSVGSP
jgi:hypothetical protein